ARWDVTDLDPVIDHRPVDLKGPGNGSLASKYLNQLRNAFHPPQPGCKNCEESLICQNYFDKSESTSLSCAGGLSAVAARSKR
ncbi:MAG: hypothetical protein K0U93_23470, partial [Gammaproteobacteria bacterium]|nr:hypothetical protein [Gammaproteobacteria bacterium]